MARYVEHYNTVRLHSAIGYVTPQAKLDGRAQAILAERDRKLEAARDSRKQKRQAACQALWTANPHTLQRSQRCSLSLTYANIPKANLQFTLSQYTRSE